MVKDGELVAVIILHGEEGGSQDVFVDADNVGVRSLIGTHG